VLFYTITITVLCLYLKLSSILGYLFTGALLGDYGMQIIMYKDIDQIGEYGVVFLLFTIGLEVSLERLRAMWKYVFGLGTMQMKLCSLLLSIIMYFITYNVKLSIILAMGLSLSSTAIAMQVLQDTQNTHNNIGRAGISILLLQDLIVILLLVMIPMLTNDSQSIQQLLYVILITILKTGTVLVCIFIIGRLILQPLFYITSANKSRLNHELFIATTITTALSIGYLTHLFDLSMELGAFIAGMLIAETEFQHAAETSIFPFKGLLLGLFFISVGTKINIFFIYQNLIFIILLTVTIIIIKGMCITILAIFFNIKNTHSYFIGILLSQSSEFGFIILDKLYDLKLLDMQLNNILLSMIILSMITTPILIIFIKKILLQSHQTLKEISLETQDLKNHIIIAGYDNTTRMLTNILKYKNIPYIGIEINRNKKINDTCIFHGDATKHNFLKAMQISTASTLIINISDKATVTNLIEIIKTKYEHITIIAKNNTTSYLKKLGIENIIHTEYETGIRIAEILFSNIGVCELEKNNIIDSIRKNQYKISKELIEAKNEEMINNKVKETENKSKK
ncbi:MAG: cation:proton antiporter, partial [Pseudomonadota bacterium]